MRTDLRLVRKRTKNLEVEANAVTTEPQPVVLFWGDKPAPGFEVMAKELEAERSASDEVESSVHKQAGKPQGKIGKQRN